jgi:CBS domain-containing protein
MAFLFGFLGLVVFHNPFLVFIALFVYMGASAEASMVEMRWALGGVPVSRAMVTRFQTVTPQTPLRDVIDHILAGYQQDFPVLDGGRFVGMLERGDILAALKRQGRDEPVAAAVRADCQSAEATEMLSRVFERLQGRECHALPVMQDGRLVGVIDMENLGEFIAIRSAIHQHAASPSPAPT